MPKKAKAGRGKARGKLRDPGRGEGGRPRDDRSGYQNRIRASKREKARARGCPITLLLIAMPFVFVGAAFWLLLG